MTDTQIIPLIKNTSLEVVKSKLSIALTKAQKTIQILSNKESELIYNEDNLQEIANLSGQFTLDKSFLKAYVRWYEQEYDETGVPSDRFLGYNHRRPLHINKVCMLISAAESSNMVLTDVHFEKALAIMQLTEHEMPNAFYGLGLSNQANVYAKILSFIESHDSFDWLELCRTFHLDVDNISQLRGYLEMAEQSGLVKAESSATSSRYISIANKPVMRDPEYLNRTVFRLMDRNIIKN